MTRFNPVSRFAAALCSSVLILGLTVDILDEMPSGDEPPAAVERAPITSPQLNGPFFQQGQAEAAAATAPVVSATTEGTQTAAAPAPAEVPAEAPQMAN